MKQTKVTAEEENERYLMDIVELIHSLNFH